jgi:hypothetical protein
MPWQLCIHFHLLCPTHLRPPRHPICHDDLTTPPLWTSKGLTYPTSSHLRNLDIHETMMIRHPFVTSSLPPATCPLRREANSEPTTMSSTLTFINSENPGHPSPWCLAIQKHQLCYPIRISYQLWTPVLPIIESVWSSGWTPLNRGLLQRLVSSEALSLGMVASAHPDLCSKLRRRRNREGTAHKLRPHRLLRQRDQ